MNGWVVLGVGIAGFLGTYRLVFPYVLNDMTGTFGEPASDTRVMAAAMAMLLSTVWPLVLVGLVIYKVATPTTAADRRAELRKVQDEIAAGQRRRDELDRDIAARERQLGIPPLNGEV